MSKKKPQTFESMLETLSPMPLRTVTLTEDELADLGDIASSIGGLQGVLSASTEEVGADLVGSALKMPAAGLYELVDMLEKRLKDAAQKGAA